MLAAGNRMLAAGNRMLVSDLNELGQNCVCIV